MPDTNSIYSVTIDRCGDGLAVRVTGPLHPDDAAKVAARVALALAGPGGRVAPEDYSASAGYRFTIID